MPGRFPLHFVLKTTGVAATKYAYAGALMDQNYDIISVGAFPDSGSLAGQLSVFIAIVDGGATWSGNPAVLGPTNNQFASGYTEPAAFGNVLERMVGDPTDPNFFVALWGTINPRFYNRPLRALGGKLVIAVMVDNASGDSVTRAATIEVLGLPRPATTPLGKSGVQSGGATSVGDSQEW